MRDKSFERRRRLNSAIVKNLYHMLPVDDKGHEMYQPVGRGVPSSPSCGRWLSFMVCKNVDGHKGQFLGVLDCTDKVVVRHKHMWCHKSTCPICFIRGWSVRGARSITGRLEEGVRRGLGKIEHVVVGVNPEDFGLSEKVLRKRSRLALSVRGVVGGCMIFHGYRIDRERDTLVWSPHYHTLGFIKGGFNRCRDCVHVRGDCYTCSGFKGREAREFVKDKYLVKVLHERETVFGTAFYQMNHATIRLGVKRFHTVTYFGVCGNRKYGSKATKAEDVCPVCGDEMVRSVYVGKRHIVKDIGHPDYAPVLLFDEFDENGEPNFIDRG